MVPSFALNLRSPYPEFRDLLKLLAELTGLTTEELEEEFSEQLALRIFFVLLGEVSGATSITSIRHRIAERISATEDEVWKISSALADALNKLETAELGYRSSLAVLPYPQRNGIREKTSNRCGICGLSFQDEPPVGRELYEAEPQLDHRVPYRIGGDRDENLWLLCRLCNVMKRERLHVGEHGKVWNDNYIYHRGLRAIAFWAMSRDKQCREPGCDRGPRDSRLFVARRNIGGAWVLDNCITYCEEHAKHRRSIPY